MEVSKLLSPPAPDARDRFSPVNVPVTPKASSTQLSRPPPDDMGPPPAMANQLFSPPETPANRPIYPVEPSTTDAASPVPIVSDAPVRDPVLFATGPGSESGVIVADHEPLFSSPAPPAKVDPKIDALVTQHMATHQVDTPHKPTRDEYLLALSIIPIVSQRYAENPRRWLQQERRILDERFGKAGRVAKRVTNKATLAKIAPAPAVVRPKRLDVWTPAMMLGDIPETSKTTKAPRAPRAPRPPKLTPIKEVVDRDTPRRVVAPSREDVDFGSLPDYSPSTSTLPANNNAKCLKADWRGQMLDLSKDPHRHLLHPAELNLAATLRLSGATYLCSKRRIFQARLEALRIGKEFRKTDSQQACKIDVNKASKLWSAYERVGWFNPDHFRKYL